MSDPVTGEDHTKWLALGVYIVDAVCPHCQSHMPIRLRLGAELKVDQDISRLTLRGRAKAVHHECRP